jgi:hypothetical protein
MERTTHLVVVGLALPRTAMRGQRTTLVMAEMGSIA